MENKILYICLRCKYNCSNKYNFRKHLLKKKICEPILRDIDIFYLLKKLDSNEYINFYDKTIKEVKCKYCDKYYSNKCNMLRHCKKCENNIQNELQPTKIQNELQPTIHNELQQPKTIQNNNNIETQNIETQNNQNIETQNNIQTQNNQHITININTFGNEKVDVKELYKLLSFDSNSFHFHQENDKYNFQKRLTNYIDNFNIIFDNVYEEPENQNFDIVNKKKKICKIKEEENYKHISFIDLSNKIFNIIDNIYDLSIMEYELNNDTQSLNHYREFKKVFT
jgi:hypothetical protein